MAPSMRWFGPADSVTLGEIRQTGATDVFTSLHQIPYGEAWPEETIAEHKAKISAAGLRWAVVESLPVSEAIKTRTGDFEAHIAAYQLTLRRLGAAGVPVVVYNFMPVLDWVRTDVRHRLSDGSETLLYDPLKFAAFDLFALERPGAEAAWTSEQVEGANQFWSELTPENRAAFARQILDLFPGVRMNMSLADLRARLEPYSGLDETRYREHLRLFLQEVAPVAEEAGVRLALHPDDPPFPILGLPRIACRESDLAQVLSMADTPANGLCYCTGSLGVLEDNDLSRIAKRFGPRIHAVHLRSVTVEPSGVFWEASHLGGGADMYEIIQALLEEQAVREREGRVDWQLSFRPDHGHRILDDFRRPDPVCPGYPLIGRLRGLAELRGLQVGVSRGLIDY